CYGRRQHLPPFPTRRSSDLWEAKRGAFASIQRALGAGGKHYALARTNEVLGQATQLEPGFCHVQLTADVRRERAVRIQGALVIRSEEHTSELQSLAYLVCRL